MKYFFVPCFFACLPMLTAQIANDPPLIGSAYYYLAPSNPIPQEGDSICYYYDEQNRLNGTMYWRYGPPNTWYPHTRSTNYVYDSNDSLVYFELEDYLLVGYIKSAIVTRHFDTQSRLVSDTTLYRDGSTWTVAGLNLYTYDPQGKLKVRYNKSGNMEYKYLYAYYPSKQLRSENLVVKQGNLYQAYKFTEFFYDTDTDERPAYKTLTYAQGVTIKETYTYDNAGNVTERVVDYIIDNQAYHDWKFTYTYDQFNREISFYRLKWKNDAWEKDVRTTTTYDDQLNVGTTKTEVWYPGWILSGVERKYYRATTPTINPEILDLKVYPNPATQIITVNGDNWISATLFDASGHLLRRVRFNDENNPQIDVRDIAPGACFLYLVDKAGRTAGQQLLIAH